ncbi:hypothetical protein AABD42_14440 [Staphylococcus shinii]|jgi:dolichol kinase|uniref:hypothetical protein n=1 Tax=Staphylococcus TaxID=1279 RepID=UPI0011A41297|nr:MULTISPECIES: hypothetical protein [Staphylococcus]MBF7023310.1 hypothetical protein [Staphylococcus kloosii]MBF7023340.1 hypothetical protein [Staphylococcus kloosii]MDW8556126.1 hypothetical protein [Staphylococcus xylosus]MDW8556136.1 hypothetical protein [Staphylococcus xylosus]
MAKPKLRILLQSLWFFLVVLLLLAMIFLKFDLFSHWWMFVIYFIACTFIGPFINKVAPKKKRSNENEKI